VQTYHLHAACSLSTRGVGHAALPKEGTHHPVSSARSEEGHNTVLRGRVCLVEAAQSLQEAAAWHLLGKEDLAEEVAVGRRRSMEARARKYKMRAQSSSSLKEPIKGLGC